MREFGEPGVLRLERVATPRPGPDEVLVRVAAVEVSRTRDVATRTGKHPFSRHVSLPHILGGHFTGVVVSVGEAVDPSVVGKRVAVMNHHTCGRCAACRAGLENECGRLEMLGVHRWGSYAEFTSAPAEILHILPDDIDMVQAAALAATGPVGLTQFRTAHTGQDTIVLVTGLTGALASLLAALGPVLGATVIALSRRPQAVVPGTRAIVLDSTRHDLGDAIVAATGGAKPQVVIDNVCAPDVFERYFPALANGARIVVSGAIGTPQLPILPVPARELYSRTISLIGVRSHTQADAVDFWQMVRDGFRLPPELIHEYPLEAASSVHRAVQDGSTTGHTVLRISGGTG
ncbi:alcohol dehydrogenase catalytic domain-containing protein [Streptomyces sp. NPDC001177]